MGEENKAFIDAVHRINKEHIASRKNAPEGGEQAYGRLCEQALSAVQAWLSEEGHLDTHPVDMIAAVSRIYANIVGSIMAAAIADAEGEKIILLTISRYLNDKLPGSIAYSREMVKKAENLAKEAGPR